MSSEKRIVGVLFLTAFLAAIGAPLSAASDTGAEWKPVDRVLRQTGKDQPAGVRKYVWPRTDLRVELDAVTVEPALALTSWAAFLATRAGEAMAMGDLVLTGPEVNEVVRELQSGGLEVLAIHNHLIGESPRVLYVHFHAHGPAEPIAKGLLASLGKTKTPLEPLASTPAAPQSARAEAAFESIQKTIRRRGTVKGTVLQVAVPRAERIQDGGITVPPSMGLAAALNFQITGRGVATTGDLVLTADEVNPVIRELQSHGIRVTALHSHMLRESPRLFFLHFWGLGAPVDVAEGVRAALVRVASAP